MGNNKYTIGVDFGTQSGRGMLVDVATGEEIAIAEKSYTHGVMDDYLPDGKTKLDTDWALQHPADYLEVLEVVIPQIIKQSGVDVEDIIGLGIDFTTCTILPIDREGNPLCYKDEYKSKPHSYVKLWKHHAAQDEANKVNDVASGRSEEFLLRYGGKISSEWLVPKVWQILDEAPDIYENAHRFIEAGDWVVLQLTGLDRRNCTMAGYKAIWHKEKGYPSHDFFKQLDPRLENVVEDKLSADIYPQGAKAGEIIPKAASLTGLKEGTVVSVANSDAHVAVPAVGITKPGQMLMIMGTSTCHIMLGESEELVPGICGVVEDGVLPGFMGYEAGQSCVGDHFEWFVENCLPKRYIDEAKRKEIDIHALLVEKANQLNVGESGLVALDWWNGNRSVLVDADLTGMIVGMTLLSKPEEIYRALIEATGYGTRMIIDTFQENGVPINEIFAAGGISKKNEMMMQIYADITNREIRIGASSQLPALGSAMFAAVAAGKNKGGYDDIVDAVNAMGSVPDKIYMPIKENVESYEMLYREYKVLHDYFGRGENDVMKRLKEIKKKATSQ